MRPIVVFAALFALACAGGPDPAPSEAASQPGATAQPGATTTGAAAAAPIATPEASALGGPELASHWLVILASKLDPAEAVPAVATIANHADLRADVGTLLSSRFKNLMPCYTVTYADATTDKAAALALSKRLRDIGVDNYVKNTGAWIGPSAAVDAYCNGGEEATANAVIVPANIADTLWIPVAAPQAVVEAALTNAPKPVAMNERFDAWIQPATNPPGGASGARYTGVDAHTGRTVACTSARVAALTLGVPHFAVVQEGAPKAPACGEAALYTELSCSGETSGNGWIVVPEGTPLTGYTRHEGGEARASAAEASIATRTEIGRDPTNVGDYGGMEVERSVSVTLWTGPTGELALVEATRTLGPGVGGGYQTIWTGVYKVEAGTLGAPLGELIETEWSSAFGLVDVGADGKPDLVVTEFPSTTAVIGTDGARHGALELPFCDCAC